MPFFTFASNLKVMNNFKFFIFILLPAFVACSDKAAIEQPTNNEPMDSVLLLMKKKIIIDSSIILYDKPLTQEAFLDEWTVHHSDWEVKEGWLYGSNKGNWPGMAVLKKDFPGNVMLEFEAQTILPSSHDINVMWNGEWNDSTDQRGIAYVAGLQGWWTGKVGIEKSNDYKFMVGTPLFDFIPGKIYKIIAGSIDGHCFIFANGKLLLEAMDPNPIDNQKYTKVGFEAYCSNICIRNIVIRQICWQENVLKYEPEF